MGIVVGLDGSCSFFNIIHQFPRIKMIIKATYGIVIYSPGIGEFFIARPFRREGTVFVFGRFGNLN